MEENLKYLQQKEKGNLLFKHSCRFKWKSSAIWSVETEIEAVGGRIKPKGERTDFTYKWGQVKNEASKPAKHSAQSKGGKKQWTRSVDLRQGEEDQGIGGRNK